MQVKNMKKEDFGAIEQHLMSKITRETINCLEEVWKIILPVKIYPGEVEFDSRYITSVSHDEMFVVTYFSTKIEESTGVLTLALPYTSLEPIKQKLTSTVGHDEQKANYSWMSSLKEYIPYIDANVSVELGRKNVTVRDLLTMRIGEVIMLDQFIGDELLVYAEGVPKFKGYPGHYKGNNALNITSLLSNKGTIPPTPLIEGRRGDKGEIPHAGKIPPQDREKRNEQAAVLGADGMGDVKNPPAPFHERGGKSGDASSIGVFDPSSCRGRSTHLYQQGTDE